MATDRSRFAGRLCAANPQLTTLIDAADGWPSLIECETSRGRQRIALYTSPVNRLYPNTRPNDYRVQNPGSGRPITSQANTLNMAIGWWTDDQPPVMVACDPVRWESSARISQMFKLQMIRDAQARGWASYQNNNGDVFHAFRPYLFPTYVEAVIRSVDLNDLSLTRNAIQNEAVANLEGQGNTPVAAERARVACTRLVRSTAFTRDVVTAYGGRCAICGLNFGLGQAAHIYPVAAPGSTDEVGNGLFLCPNHHSAFDRHLIWIDPDSGAVRLHASLRAGELTVGDKGLVDTALSAIRLPAAAESKPSPEMFKRRYRTFQIQYGWVR